MTEKINSEIKFIKQGIGSWISEHTEVTAVSADTVEVATTEIDAYGDTIYCFVKKCRNKFQISDEGRILFKLDPGQLDTELYQTAEEIALGVGFDFAEDDCSISVVTTRENLVQAIVKLAQLQLAISYLG